MEAQSQPICRFLDWDTQFFGIRIAQVSQSSIAGDAAKAVLSWCQREKIDCLYYLAPVTDIASIHTAEKIGFHFVDIRLTFRLPLNQPQTYAVDPHIRLAQNDDIPGLKEISRLVYRSTRFFNDPNFPPSLCRQLYSTWIEKSCLGYAQAVWVTGAPGEPSGFVTCHLENGLGRIGLIGIHPDSHHQGWGRKLLTAALNWFATNDCQVVQVVTQGSNQAAQRLYETNGFVISSVELWYHLWLDHPSLPGSQ